MIERVGGGHPHQIKHGDQVHRKHGHDKQGHGKHGHDQIKVEPKGGDIVAPEPEPRVIADEKKFIEPGRHHERLDRMRAAQEHHRRFAHLHPDVDHGFDNRRTSVDRKV